MRQRTISGVPKVQTNAPRGRNGCKIVSYAKTLIAGAPPTRTFRFPLSSLGLYFAVAAHCLSGIGVRRGAGKFLRAPVWAASPGLRSCKLLGSRAFDACRRSGLHPPGASHPIRRSGNLVRRLSVFHLPHFTGSVCHPRLVRVVRGLGAPRNRHFRLVAFRTAPASRPDRYSFSECKIQDKHR